MFFVELALGIVLIFATIQFVKEKRKNKLETELISEHINSSDELKRTLAMGLYMRFRKENLDEENQFSDHFIRQNPLLFENFVAEIIEKARGGTTWVSPPSGDFGVDFEHTTDDGLYLGQVKCYKNNMLYEPIAILHSNMVKQGAKGGYVVTTASFTKAAKEYARGLNIELIDGVKLVELWIEALQSAEEEIKDIIPQTI
jgi:restriction system protein